MSHENSEASGKRDVTRAMVTDTPAIVYRYRPGVEHDIASIRDRKIFFSSPSAFSDPFDCAITPDIIDPTDDDVASAMEDLRKRPGQPSSVIAEYESLPWEELRRKVRDGMATAVRELTRQIAERNGVACFTTKNDNLLMWAHYADAHRGICLAYRAKYEPFVGKLHYVNYVREVPHVSYAMCNNEPGADDLLRILYRTKSYEWHYEEEWRAFYDRPNRLFEYPVGILKGIYLGARVRREIVDGLREIFRDRRDEVEFYRGRLSTTRFRIEFDAIEYEDLKSVYADRTDEL